MGYSIFFHQVGKQIVVEVQSIVTNYDSGISKTSQDIFPKELEYMFALIYGNGPMKFIPHRSKILTSRIGFWGISILFLVLSILWHASQHMMKL